MSTMSSSTAVPDPMDIDSPRPVSSDSSLYGSSPTRTSLLTRLANSPPCSNSYFSNHLPASQILPSRPNHPLMQNHNSPQVALQIPNSDTNTITPPYANAYNPYLSSPSAYQFTTPLSTFLSTYPPSTTPSSAIGSSPLPLHLQSLPLCRQSSPSPRLGGLHHCREVPPRGIRPRDLQNRCSPL